MTDRKLLRVVIIDDIIEHQVAMDAQRIKLAVGYGQSRFNKDGRGKGLSDAKDFVQSNPMGTMIIYSGFGDYTFHSNTGKEELRNLPSSFGGTLIQWNLRLESKKMSSPFEIKVLDFSDMPHGRDDDAGLSNGQRFRKEVLLPALKLNDLIEINFEGVKGCGSSFADESFAGLITHEGFTKDEVVRRITYKYKYKSVIKNIYKYIDEAAAKKAMEA